MLSREETFWTPTGSVRALTTGIYGPAGPCATGRTQPAVSGWLTHASQGIKRFHDVPWCSMHVSQSVHANLHLTQSKSRATASQIQCPVAFLSNNTHEWNSSSSPAWTRLKLDTWRRQHSGFRNQPFIKLHRRSAVPKAPEASCPAKAEVPPNKVARGQMRCNDGEHGNSMKQPDASHSLQGWMLLVEQKPPGFHVQHFPAHYNAFLYVGCPQLPNSTASLRILVAILRSSNTPALFTVKHSHKNMRVQNTSKTLLVVPNSQWSIWRVGTCSSCEWSTACTTWARMRIPSGPSCTCHHHQIRWHEPWAYLLRHILSKSFDRTLRCPEQTTYSFISHHTSIWKHSREVQVRMCERANVACEPAAPARLLAWAKRPQDTDQTTPSTLNIKTWATLEMVPTNYLKQCWKNACRS